MVALGGLAGLLLLVLWVFCIIDVITSDQAECRHLPKLLWLLIVLLLPDVGSILWLVLGRPRGARPANGIPYKGNTSRFPEYERPGRHVAANPDDDEAFLRALRERAEQQRRAAREQRPLEE